MRIAEIVSLAQFTMSISDQYTARETEGRIEPIFYTAMTLQNPDIKIGRQHHLRVRGQKWPNLMDVRLGGFNPHMIEVVSNPFDQKNSNRLFGPQNRKEGRKLASYSQAEVKWRTLLLFDYVKFPVDKERLIASYKQLEVVGAGSPIRVIYVHKDLVFTFLWSVKGFHRA